MISSKVAVDYSKMEKLTYPYIGKVTQDIVMYVLFTKPKTGILLYSKPKTGILLYSKDEISDIGIFSDCWNEEDFSYTEDAVTLKNR